MLIIEVILTIVAWIRGWKGYALIPLIMAVTIGFTIGFAAPEEDLTWLVLIDLIAIIALIGMVVKKRGNKSETSSEASNVMYCTKCGTRNDSNAFRCTNCGIIIQQMPPIDN